MFTTDELEAAGQRAASHPVEVVPDVAEIQREVARRRQSKRLLIGASTATVMLFGIGGILLLGARDNQVQVITASPVLESETTDSELAGQQARTGADGGSDGTTDDDVDDAMDGGSGTAGEDDEDGAAGGSSAASSSSTSDDDDSDGEVTSGYTTTIKDGDDGQDGDTIDFDDLDFDDADFVFPEDMKEWLDDLKDRGPIDGEWRDYDLWPFAFAGVDLDITVGEEAIAAAAAARSQADDSFIADGRTIWIDRQTSGNESRHRATVSTLVDDEWFVSAAGPADQEAALLRLISQYDGDWEERLIPEDLDRMRDQDWLTWPPTEDDFKEWEEARKDWLKDHEELLKESQEQVEEARKEAEEARKQAEEERKRVEEERKRIEEERNNGGDDDDDDDDDD